MTYPDPRRRDSARYWLAGLCIALLGVIYWLVWLIAWLLPGRVLRGVSPAPASVPVVTAPAPRPAVATPAPAPFSNAKWGNDVRSNPPNSP